jgi:hypothetical protein
MITRISVFDSLTNTTRKSDQDIFEVLQEIKEGKHKEKVQDIRQGNSKLKQTLPCICWSGIFSKRKAESLQEKSGLICLDYDKVEDLQGKKQELINDEYTFAVFISPSGNGLKQLVKVDVGGDHSSQFLALEQAYPEIDPSGKDISRICFHSYDPEIYINEKSKIWTQEKRARIFKPEDNLLSADKETTRKNLQKWFTKKYTMEEGTRNKSLFDYACALYEFGVDNVEAILQENSNGLPESEVKTLMESASKTVVHNSKKFEPSQSQEIIKPLASSDHEINVKVINYKDVIYVIQDILGYKVRYNQITQFYEIDGQENSDNLESKIWGEVDYYLKKIGCKKDLSRTLLNSAIVHMCKDYNPLQEFFTNNEWDGTARLQDFLSHFKDRHGVASEYLTHFMFGSVQRLFKTHQNPVLVLDGNQSMGKSYLVKWLAKPFGSKYYKEDGYLNPDDKDSKLELTTNFMYEWGEAKNFSQKEIHSLKSLVFSDNITERRPYARYAQERKLIANIIMTKNGGDGFLRDDTGNRRFHTLFMTEIDKSYSEKFDPAQIWLEVYALWLIDKEENWKTINLEAKDAIDKEAFDEPACWAALDEVVGYTGEEMDDFLTAHSVHDYLSEKDHKWDRNKKMYQEYVARFFRYRFGVTSTTKDILNSQGMKIKKRGYKGYVISTTSPVSNPYS